MQPKSKSNQPPKRPKLDADRYRKTELAKIHVAKQQMKLDEDTYRALLARITGKDSAADLTAPERNAVLNEFYRLGWSAKSHRIPDRKAAARPAVDWDKGKLISKIGALLADAGRPWAYADGCARNMFALTSIRFCTTQQLRKIVAALVDDQRRREQAPSPPAPLPLAGEGSGAEVA